MNDVLMASFMVFSWTARFYVTAASCQKIRDTGTLMAIDCARPPCNAASGVGCSCVRNGHCTELERLYSAPGLDQYRPEAVLANLVDGGLTPALCYNLRNEPQADERNAAYATRLQGSLRELGFPPDYIDSVVTC